MTNVLESAAKCIRSLFGPWKARSVIGGTFRFREQGSWTAADTWYAKSCFMRLRTRSSLPTCGCVWGVIGSISGRYRVR